MPAPDRVFLPQSAPGIRPALVRRAVTSAPMRVSFAGGGSDVPPIVPGVGGRVVGAAIGLRARATVEPFDRGWLRLESSVTGRAVTRRASEPPRSELDLRLVEAALADAGIEDGARVVVDTPVSPGTGLGGSSAVGVALLHALWTARSGDPSADPDRLVGGAVRLERTRLRNAGGSQDPIFATHGGVLDLTFGAGTCTVRRLETSGDVLLRFASGLLLIDTLVRRVSGSILTAAPAGASAGSAAALVRSAAEVARGFAIGSLEHVLEAMRQAAAAKVARNPAGCALAVELAERLEPLGAEVVRTCGAGGGGHVVVWAPPERHAAISAAVAPWPVVRTALGAPGVRLEE